MYPYRIRITDPIEIQIFKKVSNQRYIKIKPNKAKSIGHKIPKKVKRDGVIIKDGIFAIYNPRLNLSYEPAYGRKKGYDFFFKTLY